VNAFPVIEAQALRERVGLAEALPAAREAYRAYSAGGMRIAATTLELDRGDVHLKGGVSRSGELFVAKIASWIPAATAHESAVASGAFLVCSARTGQPLALLLEKGYLTHLRTAAAGAVAAEALASEECAVAGVLGSGEQAFLQLLALHAVRPFTTAYVWGRRHEAAAALAQRLSDALPRISVQVAANAREVVLRADVLVTATASRVPLVESGWLRAGQHVNAIGADDEAKHELDVGCFTRADRLFVDSVEQTARTAELGAAIAAGALPLEAIDGEIGAVLSGRLPGRRGPDEITVAKMTGIGALDLTIAEAAMRAFGLGTRAPGTRRRRPVAASP
jgi:ornithine cyclodeaminase/alanine dehydrogenase-like protein (mu-crystallin family)